MSLLRFLGIGTTSERQERGETETVRRIAGQLDRLPAEQARYLASFAFVLARVAHADLEIDAQHLGGTENYVVTREFRQSTTREQRVDLLRCIYAVAAADGTISGVETNEIRQIAEELGFTRPEANALRSEYRDQLAELQTPAAREREPR